MHEPKEPIQKLIVEEVGDSNMENRKFKVLSCTNYFPPQEIFTLQELKDIFSNGVQLQMKYRNSKGLI